MVLLGSLYAAEFFALAMALSLHRLGDRSLASSIFSTPGLQTHLEPHEHARLLESTARGYHRSLGTNIVHGIGLTKGFRRFHRQGRKCCGFEPSWGSVAVYAIAEALDLLLNPKSTFESAVRRLR